jgi:hypothetical protein
MFLLFEKRAGERAMVPLSLFGSRGFVALTLLTLFLYAALGELFVLLPFVLIRGAGYSAIEAGAALLPLPITLAFASPLAGSLADRIGTRWLLAVGPLVVAAGFVLALRIGSNAPFLDPCIAGRLGYRSRSVRGRRAAHNCSPKRCEFAIHRCGVGYQQRRGRDRRSDRNCSLRCGARQLRCHSVLGILHCDVRGGTRLRGRIARYSRHATIKETRVAFRRTAVC